MSTTTTTTTTRHETFTNLHKHLQTFTPPLTLPPHPITPHLSSDITDLRLHPALEAALHLLNHDLSSAHFLLRKMQSLPAAEGMFLHGILHRIEGDFPNALAWYSDVAETDVVAKVWGGKGYGKEGDKPGERGKKFVEAVQLYVEKGEGERGMLEQESGREIGGVVEWCLEKWGTEEWRDARDAYVRPSEKIKKAGEAQVTGDEQRKYAT
ncbi:hypothetical protein EDC01DRAFT_611033 [Geopyxis carbonaria]|nr:hypothetical protein EDC01DRAFT_611033 [Geopyxis carbonaria]